MVRFIRNGIKLGVLSFVLAVGVLLQNELTRPASAAVVRCNAGGGDRREQNRIDAVRLTATVDQNNQEITLTWPDHNASSYNYNIFRKTRDSLDWGSPIATRQQTATSYTDTAVTLGEAYEYRVERSGGGCTNQNGYIYAGLDAPLTDQRGTVILIVEDVFETSLASELDLFEQDLRGDGWGVVRHFVPCFEQTDNRSCPNAPSRQDAVAQVKNLIQTEYNAAPDEVKAVFLVGHIAVPYSGHHATDGHDQRAWPADTYYGDVDGTWTDSWNNGGWMSNPNVAGDGVWDQTETSPQATGADTAPELMVGRVDMSNMYFFEQNGESKPDAELRLLRHYFEKNHNFRHGITRVRQRGLLMDRFGEGQGWETPGVAQWTSMSPLVGSAESWFDGNSDNNGGAFTDGIYMMHYRKDKFFNPDGYIIADVSGPSVTDNMFDSYSSQDYASDMPPVIFFNKFGSYFGDWDQWNNLLRASIAGETYGLATVWGGWGTWTYHHMGLGEPIGNTVLATHLSTLSQSNGGDLYETWYGRTRPEMSIMGDPTLRMHVVDPPSNLTAQSRSASLNWSASPDTDVIGYHVYRADTPSGVYSRLTNNPVNGTSFVDTTAVTGTYSYMVRAVKLENTPSGTYYNASQGTFLTTEITSGSATQTAFEWHSVPGTIQAESFDNGGMGVAYFDLSSGDNGSSGYRNTDVDILEFTSGQYKVGWTESGEWLEYTVDADAGTYRVDFQFASDVLSPGSLRLYIDGQDAGAVDAQQTSGWNDFETFSLHGVTIDSDGTKVIRLEVVGDGFDIDSFTFVNVASAPTAVELMSLSHTVSFNYAGVTTMAAVLGAVTLCIWRNNFAQEPHC